MIVDIAPSIFVAFTYIGNPTILVPFGPDLSQYSYLHLLLRGLLSARGTEPMVILFLVLFGLYFYFLLGRVVERREHAKQLKGTETQYLAARHYLRKALILFFFLIPFLILDCLRFIKLRLTFWVPIFEDIQNFGAVLEWFAAATPLVFPLILLIASVSLLVILTLWVTFIVKEKLAAFRFESFLISLWGGRNKLLPYRSIVNRFSQALEEIEALVKPYVKIANQRILVGQLGSAVLSNSSHLDSIQVEVAGLTLALCKDDSEKTVGHLTTLVQFLSEAQEECKVFVPETARSRWGQIKQTLGRDDVIRLLIYLVIAAILFVFWLITGFRIPIPP